MKGNVGSISVYGADKSRFGQAGQFDNFAIGLMLVKDKVDSKIFALLVDRGATFAKSVLGTCNFLTGLSAFNNIFGLGGRLRQRRLYSFASRQLQR